MLCNKCGEQIPAARLKAMPSATSCVTCLISEGDVPLAAQLTDNSRNYFNVPDSVYKAIPGDDSYVERPEAVQHISAYALSEAFEDE